tara:strand:- start:51 stop:362 length:312 start_codon:yes stop_codon:yes gene_type:complete
MLTTLIVAYGICFGLMNDKAKFLTDLLKKIPLFSNDRGTFFERMLVCSYCTGFHCGWMAYILTLLLQQKPVSFPHNLVEATMVSFASAIFCYSVDVIVQWFER